MAARPVVIWTVIPPTPPVFAMSTINIVKYYFYRGTMPQNPELLRRMVALAYQSARVQKLYPKAILIRSHLHDTTSVGGRHVKDPSGWHLTFYYKDGQQILTGRHTACHGYTTSGQDFTLVKATDSGEKLDSTLKRNGMEVWPQLGLEEAPDIGYSHLDE